jgi:putative nucleotidyltransferase with HDIG domain
MVANLGEAACKDIRANALLARVGGFYHDIGKIEDAGIYIENKGKSVENVKMDPLEYSRRIIDHVRKGVALAHKNGLPQSVIDFIQQHHGTTIMSYFYHEALEEAQRSDQFVGIEKSQFQYPGPRPATKETAIIMLADAVEASTRSLQNPTPPMLEEQVRKIIMSKLNDGELDLSDLNMLELNKVQKSFIRVLTGIFHTRIEYPDRDVIEKLENQAKERRGEG